MRSFRHWKRRQPSQSQFPQNRPSPRFGPRRPRVPSLRPRWGNDPPPPGQGPVWATQGPVWQKRKKTAQPGKQLTAQTAHTPALGFPSSIWFPQKPAVVRGVKNKQVKGPGSPTGVPCRVTSPGRAGRSGIFPRRQFPHFPGSVWRPWGHGRGQKTRISRRQAIFPGVTAGVSERIKKSMAEKDLKRKFALWIRPSLLEEVDSLYESDN